MPELPEVETVRRTMERVLTGRRIDEIELPEDPILLEKRPAQLFHDVLVGAEVLHVGRKGKFWWLELRDRPFVYGHLGMSGWIREIGAETIRLKEHGKAPLDDETGRPRFLRLLLVADTGRKIAFTDGRRLGRMWLGDNPEVEPRVSRLGPDCWLEPMGTEELKSKLEGKKAPIKAVLLDQSLFAGVGNWIADEVLYQAEIGPARKAGSLSQEELDRLLKHLETILKKAVDVGADEKLYPKEWLFHHRWGGAKGEERIHGEIIVRETIGGRTTAWVPSRQK